MTTREGTLLGPYRLLRRIGGGGAGDVYVAEGPANPNNSNPSGQVAVKVLTGAASDATARAIAQQAHAAGQLGQTHIIPHFGVVEEAGILGVVMAYAPGGSLGDTLRASRSDGSKKLTLPLESGIVGRLVSQLGRAFEAAHAGGLVHGDLKPNNVFVRTAPNGRPIAVVSDFGQSVLTSAAAAVLSRGVSGERGAWASSQLLFAAPEQLHGECTPASDQYGLAALTYFLLTGQPPVIGDGPSLLANIVNESVTPPSQLNPALSPETDTVLLQALAKSPAGRYPSIALFAQAMDEALAVAVGGAATSLTQGFAQLAGSTPGMARPAGMHTPARSGVRVIDRSGSSARSASPAAALSLPQDAPARVNRRLSIIAAVAMVIVLLACGLTFRAISSGLVLPHITLGVGAAGGAVTPTANVKATATAQNAAQELAVTTGGAPVFSDPLADNSHHWSTQGKTVYFAADGLHLANTSTKAVLTENMPGSPPPLSDEVVQVTLKLAQGDANSLAGLRFFVQPAAGGGQSYYSFVISAQGAYEVWVQSDGNWAFVTRGSSSALRTGAGASNTIAVVGHGKAGTALLFANGQYLAALTVGSSGAISGAPAAGTGGLIVMDTGAEFVFTKYAFYRA